MLVAVSSRSVRHREALLLIDMWRSTLNCFTDALTVLVNQVGEQWLP